MPTVPVEPRNPRKPSRGKKIGAVQFVIAHAHVHAHEAVARRAAREQRAELRADGAFVQIEQAVLDVVRLLLAGQHQPIRRTLQFVVQRSQRLIGVAGRNRRDLPCARGACRRARPDSVARRQQRARQQTTPRPQSSSVRLSCSQLVDAHRLILPCACRSCAGGGKMGGRSVEVCFFCTSISEISSAGAAAATGTEPDSAPQ